MPILPPKPIGFLTFQDKFYCAAHIGTWNFTTRVFASPTGTTYRCAKCGHVFIGEPEA